MTLSERLREWGIPTAIKAVDELDRLYALRDQSDKDQAIYEEKIDRLTARITAIMEQPPHPRSPFAFVLLEVTLALQDAFREADEQRFGPHFHDAYRAMIAADPKSTP